MPFLGEAYALLAALSWSLAVICFRASSGPFDSSSLNFVKTALALVGFILSILFLDLEFFPSLPLESYLLLSLSAFLGITVGDYVHIVIIKELGASLQALLSTMYSPLMILAGYLFFDEKISLVAFLGIFLVLGAIYASLFSKNNFNFSKLQLSKGFIVGVLAEACMVASVLVIREELKLYHIFWITFYRFLIGTALILPIYFKKSRRKSLRAVFVWSRQSGLLVLGALLGPYLATVFWLLGYKYAIAGKVAVLNQLSTLLIVIFAALFLKEKLSFRFLFQVLVAFLGALLIVLY